MKLKRRILLPFSLLMLIALIFPVVYMIFSGFKTMDGSFSLDNYREIFTQNYYQKAVLNSIILSLVAALIGECISILGAWAVTRLSEKVQSATITLFNMATSFAGIPLAFSLIILFGNSGVTKAISQALNIGILDKFDIYSLPGLILAFTFFEVPLGIMFLYPAIKEIKHEWQEASLVLGANTSFFVRTIIFPLLLPNIVETFIILFANAMGTYETMYALTGNNIITIPIVIGSLINGSLNANIPLACALATIFALIMTILVLLGNRLTSKRQGE